MFSRISKEASNAFSDAYSNLVLGDDAGKSARLVLNCQGSAGLKLLEINDRAYVHSVAPGSQAFKAGILPRDAVQYALSTTANQQEDSIKVALQSEKQGLRVSHDELRQMMPPESFLAPPSSSKSPRSRPMVTPWKPIPATINVCSSMRGRPNGGASGVISPLQSPRNGGDPNQIIILVFRRTRQRHSASTLAPSFRLDDECDVAATLVQRLAPTVDMNAPMPDVWDEFVHDGTDWLLGNGSILPPKGKETNQATKSNPDDEDNDPSLIPLDSWERARAQKMATLRSQMTAEAMAVDRTQDVEAVTIRGMIQKAVGLAFIRASKVVLGVSLHAGTGVVVARLSDGTWSAPSAIGTWGLGLGLQFGLEVAEFIFVLQTNEALDHFKRGGSFTIGGNIGAAVAGMGREAYGAASVGGMCGSDTRIDEHEDEYNDTSSRDGNNDGSRRTTSSIGVAPIVAYAKSQGLYVGVSLEGSRIFTRDDVNHRTYKFTSGGKSVSANDILRGKVPTPPEAEDLYAALHSVEFTHEMSCLPRPPETLREDSPNSWRFDRNTLGHDTSKEQSFPFLVSLPPTVAEECEAFETQFKKFMYGGVSVQRLIPTSSSESSSTRPNKQRTRRERRTLWLMLPEVGSLRLGFVSKLSDEDGAAVSNKSSTLRVLRKDDNANDDGTAVDSATCASEEVTLDSALVDKDNGSAVGQIRTGNVELSNKHSLALTDVTLLSHDPLVPVKFKEDDQTEHLRVISIQEVSGTSLLFLTNNFREAELLLCGLKLLLERETNRLGVRGGRPLSTLCGHHVEGAMSPSMARGRRGRNESPISSLRLPSHPRRRGRSNTSMSSRRSGYSSSDVEDMDGSVSSAVNPSSVPTGWRSWGRVPGRNYMRGQAAAASSSDSRSEADEGIPKYSHGQLLVRDLAKGIRLPLPLPLCRVLLLDSSSPVITAWERERGDLNFEKTPWTFPPATPRESEQYQSEHQLIASGSMCGAHRTTSFQRHRNGALMSLTETQVVESDDSEKLIFTVTERLPRRGFSIKVRVIVRPFSTSSCEATILGEIRPVGKNMSNQLAVHRAFRLVLDELSARYGGGGTGLLGSFVAVVKSMPASQADSNGSQHETASQSSRRSMNKTSSHQLKVSPRQSRRTEPFLPQEEKKESEDTKSNKDDSSLGPFEEILKSQHSSDNHQPVFPIDRPSTPSLHLQVPDSDSSRRFRSRAKDLQESNDEFQEDKKASSWEDEEAEETLPTLREQHTIEVKPLPKIRLSLMPSPREEDEELGDEEEEAPPRRRKKKSSKNWRKSSSSSSSPKAEVSTKV